MNEKTVTIAAKLYEARRAMRSLLGDRYPAKIAEYQEHIRKWQGSGEDGPIPATMRIVKRLQDNSSLYSKMVQGLLLAACVEMIEPTPVNS